MSVLRSIETKIAGLVEGTFSGVVRSEGRPVGSARQPADGGRAARPDDADSGGRTMIHSTSERASESLAERAQMRQETAMLRYEGKRLVVGPAGATIGRSRQCDVVLDDPNVSRKH